MWKKENEKKKNEKREKKTMLKSICKRKQQ